MRIAIYHNLTSGGGKRALHEMVRRLARDHALDVYTLSCAEHEFADLRPHCRRHVVEPFRPLPLAGRPFGRLNQGIRTLDLFRLQALQKKLAAQIDMGGYDVAFVHGCQFGQSPSVLRFLSTPSVYYCQEPPRQLYEPPVPRPYSEFSAMQRLGNRFDPFPAVYRWTLGRLDAAATLAASLVLVNSAYSRESLYRAYGIFARVCYLGVDTERFRPLSLPKEEFVLSVGALNPRKGFDFLLSSLALICAEQRPQLVIVCNFEGPGERHYLESLACSLEVELEVRVLVPDEELVSLYNRAVLTLYAPIMEPFGFVPLESMACGTPVVGVREAGVRESIVEGQTGLLTERDPSLFATAIMGLAADHERLMEYEAAAIRHVKSHWAWERSVSQLEAYLSEAAGSRAV
jgi:glycosyltransferase involved in cell wall biosynthesis